MEVNIIDSAEEQESEEEEEEETISQEEISQTITSTFNPWEMIEVE